jgi:hypothetical protein
MHLFPFWKSFRENRNSDYLLVFSSINIAGKIRGNTDGVTLTIPEGQNHAGCISVILPEINSGLGLEMTKQTHWQSLVQAINPPGFI